MLIILLLAGLLGLWIWSLLNMPSKRALEIFEAHGETPSAASDRDCAFVTDLYRRFGTSPFPLKAVRDRHLDREIAGQFGVNPASLDDLEALGVRLPKLNLLVSFEPGRYRLTQKGAELAERLERTHKSLENA